MFKKNFDQIVEATIEITKNSFNKFEKGFLDRVLTGSTPFPEEYGYIKNTLAEDGDEADVIVLTTYPTFSGCVIKCKIIGLLMMKDSGEEDNKILAVNFKDPFLNHINELKNVNQKTLDKIAHFFSTYKQLEGKKVIVKGWKEKEEAINFYKKCLINLKKKDIS